jgi:8-oxo-dGTP diphosphatase
MKFETRILNLGEEMPAPQEVSAVFLIALKDGNIVAIRNHRGWDLPAGHLEEGEEILVALKREVEEEASMNFVNPIPFVIVTSDSEDPRYKEKCMIGFTAKEFTLNEFVPAPDSEQREIMPVEEFLSLYGQDKVSMRSMIQAAQEILEK